MLKAITTAVAALILLSPAAIAEDLGTVDIPRTVKAAEEPLSPGTYTVAVDMGQEDPIIQLKQGSEIAAQDLAVVELSADSSSYEQPTYQTLRQDNSAGPIARIIVRYGDRLLMFYLER